jgi:hypothetical protein
VSPATINATEPHRLIAPGGGLWLTDPTVISGLVTSEEIALRASIGFFVFSPRGEDERLIREAGFELARSDDTTEHVVVVARRWHEARARHAAELLQDEGAETFAGLQHFLAIVQTLAEQRRLTRHTYLARKPAHAKP